MMEIGKLAAEKVMRKKFSKLRGDDKIPKVIKTFVKEDANVIPVFEKNRFIGEIHELDILKLVVDPKEVPDEEIMILGFELDMGYFAKTAADIVRRHEISISPKTKIKDASLIMLKQNVKSIPVIKNKKLVGILREKDILDRIVKRGMKK